MDIGFISAKGGQGVTVTAATLVALLRETKSTVTFITTLDGFAALGVPTNDGTYTFDNVTIYNRDLVNVEDMSLGNVVIRDGEPGRTQTILVTRPCYLALMRAVKQDLHPDGIIVINEPARALTAADVQRTINAPVIAEIAQEPAIARAVDAGLLATRIPQASRRAFADLVAVPV